MERESERRGVGERRQLERNEAMEKRDTLKKREKEETKETKGGRRGCRELSIPQISLLGRGSFLEVWSKGKDGARLVLQ